MATWQDTPFDSVDAPRAPLAFFALGALAAGTAGLAWAGAAAMLWASIASGDGSLASAFLATGVVAAFAAHRGAGRWLETAPPNAEIR